MRPPASPLPPWRLFFPLAAAAGIVVVFVTLAVRAGLLEPSAGWPLGRWHAHEMIFGHVTAAFAGVLLTALPRWTGAAPVAPSTTLALAGLWLTARIGFALDTDGPAAHASPIFLATLTAVAGHRIVTRRDRRDLPLIGLLCLLAVADGLMILDPVGDLGATALRMSLAAMIAIAVVMGGRVAPALTRHLAASRGTDLAVTPPRAVERATAVATTVALILWTIAPDRGATTVALWLAATIHAARATWWKGWTSLRRPSILALHLGYAFAPLGFAALAFGSPSRDPIAVDLAAHAWGVGVFGVMCLAVQASVVRRHTGRPLSVDPLADLTVVTMTIAAGLRLAAARIPTDGLLSAGALAWAAAALLLVVAALSRRDAAGPSSPPVTGDGPGTPSTG